LFIQADPIIMVLSIIAMVAAGAAKRRLVVIPVLLGVCRCISVSTC